MGGGGLGAGGYQILVKISSLQLAFLLVCSLSFVRFGKGECKLCRNFFDVFSSFLLSIVFLLYNCNTTVHVTPHSLE